MIEQFENKIINADCLDILKQLPDKCIDLIVTSPPYDNLRTYNGTLEWSFEIFQDIAKELARVLKDGGVIVWNVSDATIDGSETGTSFRQALYFKEIGFNIHDTMIWEKQTFTDTGSLKYRYAGVFEYMFIFSKGRPKTFNPIKDRENKRFGCKKHGTIRQKNGTTRKQSSLGKEIQKYGQRFNVWKVNTCCSNTERCHPAQFPISLAQDHIISWSNENDIILDCFSGSGTTAVACVNAKRRFICMEKDKEYYEASVKRLEEHQKQLTLF
jgi:site-specific DNA-methyltransferase (adenine-specific)